MTPAMLEEIGAMDPAVSHGTRRLAATSLVGANSSPSRLEHGMRPHIMELTTHQDQIVVRDEIFLSEDQYECLQKGGPEAGNKLSALADGIAKVFDLATENTRAADDEFKSLAQPVAHIQQAILSLSKSRRQQMQHDVRLDAHLHALLPDQEDFLTPVYVRLDDTMAVRQRGGRVQIMARERCTGGLVSVIDLSVAAATAVTAQLQRMNVIRASPVAHETPSVLAPAGVFQQLAILGSKKPVPFAVPSSDSQQPPDTVVSSDMEQDVSFLLLYSIFVKNSLSEREENVEPVHKPQTRAAAKAEREAKIAKEAEKPAPVKKKKSRRVKLRLVDRGSKSGQSSKSSKAKPKSDEAEDLG